MKIHAEQHSTAKTMDSSAFLAWEMSKDFKKDLQFTAECFAVLQVVSKDYLVDPFQSANLMAIQAGRTKNFPCDMSLASNLSQYSLRARLEN